MSAQPDVRVAQRSHTQKMGRGCLFLLALVGAAAQPTSWLPAIARGDMLYTPSDVAVPSNNMPMVGNGFMATQIMSSSVYVSGVYNGYLTVDPSHRARIPATNAVAAPGNTTDATLNIREATYYRRSAVDPCVGTCVCTNTSTRTCSNAPERIWIEQRWYAHRMLPSIMVMEVEVLTSDAAEQDYPGQTPTWSSLRNDKPLAMLLLENTSGGASTDIDFQTVPVGPGMPYAVVNGSTLVAETNTSGLQAVTVLTTAWPENNVLQVEAAGITYTFLTVIRTTIETAPQQLVIAAEADFAVAQQFMQNGTLHSSHVLEWEQTIWASGYEIDRVDVGLAVNTSLYAIVSSVRSDRPYGVGPGGLTAGYNGHVFWDCEIWMAPGVNLLLPDISASFVQYRFNRMQGAAEKAGSYSPPYSGLMFPWESALTGEETCPSWAPTGLREVHISGDIAVSLWEHWRSTRDNGNEWLSQIGYPLLSGIADFWVSKALLDTPGAVVPGWNASIAGVSRSAYCTGGCTAMAASNGGNIPMHLNDVIPPDEYADHVNDSVYTNAVAVLALQHATQAAVFLGYPSSTYAAWQNVSQRLVMLFNTSAPGVQGGLHPEYAGYFNSTVKQADVILLGFPLGITFGNETANVYANDLAWYARVTDPNGPAMTWGMFAIGHIVLGDVHGAAPLFNQSFANAQAPFDVWTETPTGGTPNFLTGAGGFLQVPLFGYTQLRVNDSALTMNPLLPEAASEVTLRGVSYLGQRLNITYNNSTISVVLQASPAPSELQPVRTHVYNPAHAVSALLSTGLVLAPTQHISARTQVGQVVVDSYRIAPRSLRLIASDGTSYPLTSTQAVVLPLQAICIVDA